MEDEDDDFIVVEARKTKALTELEEEKMNSSKYSSVSKRQTLTESQILNAVADFVMQEANGEPINVSMSYASLNESLSMSQKRKVGEDMIIEKINKIFDEVSKDRNEFEESY